MPEDELAALHERIVVDPAFYQELLIVEDELIDDYLADGLTSAERESFETHFLLVPERQEKLRFSRTFNKYVTDRAPVAVEELQPQADVLQHRDVPERPPKKWYEKFLPVHNPVLAYSVMAAVLVIVGGVSWLVVKQLSPTSSGPVWAVTLGLGGTPRGDPEGKEISIPRGTGMVELQVELPREEYVSYRAILLDDDRSEIARLEKLQPRQGAGSHFIDVDVPARLLLPGDYILGVTGTLPDDKSEELRSYHFRIKR